MQVRKSKEGETTTERTGKLRQATGNTGTGKRRERPPLLDVIVAIELDRRHKERQHPALDAVLALADVDIKDGAVVAAQA